MDKPEEIWQNMYAYWETLNVPEIKTLKFQFLKDVYYQPWYDNIEKRQAHYDSRPIYQTAEHLMVYLNNNSELKAAFKINVYTREDRLRAYNPVIYSCVIKDRREIDPWAGNARNLTPGAFINDSMCDLTDRSSTKEWRKVVEGASAFGTALAEQYSIIVIPDFMDENSEEYKLIEEESRKISEEYNGDYQQYLRSKEKF